MILITLRRAWTEKFDKHRAIAKWTLPLWFYVSVTGVIVYWMVYQMYGRFTLAEVLSFILTQSRQ